jgi:hypothetical protein
LRRAVSCRRDCPRGPDHPGLQRGLHHTEQRHLQVCHNLSPCLGS